MVLGHIILCGASGLALSLYTSHAITWQFGTFAILLGHGIIGVIDCISETTEQTNHLFALSLSVVDIVPLPFMNTQLYLATSYSIEVAHLHAVSGIIPVVASFFCEPDVVENLKDLVIIGNVISCAILSMNYDKPLLGVLAGITAINRFVIGKTGQTAQGLSIGLSAFSICAAYIFKNRELSRLLQ